MQFAVILFLPLNNKTSAYSNSISIRKLFLISRHCVHDSIHTFSPRVLLCPCNVLLIQRKKKAVIQIFETNRDIIDASSRLMGERGGWGCCIHRLIIEIVKMNALCHFYYLGEICHIRLLKINFQPKNETNILGPTATLYLKGM